MKRPTAATLSLALILLSPGLPCYQALAVEFEGPNGMGESAPRVTPVLPLPQGVVPPTVTSNSGNVELSAPIELPTADAAQTRTTGMGALISGELRQVAPASEQTRVSPETPTMTARAGDANLIVLDARGRQAPPWTMTASGAQTSESQAEAVRKGETAASFADQKTEKPWLLARIFDRFRWKTPASAMVDPVAGQESSAQTTLDKGAASERGPTQEPPSPQAKMMGAYVGAANATQAGYEMLTSATMPIYLEKTFGNMSWMADLSIAGTFASVAGRQLSPLIVNRFKLKTAYIALLTATFMAGLAIGGIANFGAMTVPALFGLMIAFRVLQAASGTAERTVIPSVYGADQGAIESLRGRKQSWSEVASVLVQNGAAALVIAIGSAAPNLLIAPWFYVVAIGILALTLKIPAEADAERIGGSAAAGKGGILGAISAAIKNFGRQIGLGFKVVVRDPRLRASALISMLGVLFNVITYSLLVPLFAKFAIGPGADASLGAPIIGLIAGLFSFGGLYAGKLVAKQAADVKAKHAGDAAAEAESSRRSTIKWLKYGALSFLLVGSMALPLPVFGPIVAMQGLATAVAVVLGVGTVTAMWKPKLGLAIAALPVLLAFNAHVILAAAAFFAFGLLQVVASLKNDSFFDAAMVRKAPADYANAASFVMAASMLTGALGLIAMKFLFYGKLPFGIPSPFATFAGLGGIWPFIVVFAALAVPAAILFRRAAQRLDKLTAKK